MPRTKRVDVDGPNGVPEPKRSHAVRGTSMDVSWNQRYGNLWEVAQTSQVSSEDLGIMRATDGQARGLFNLLTMPLVAALRGATIVQPNGVVGGDEEVQHIKDLLFLPPSKGGMTTPFRKFVSQMALALCDHFSGFEFEYGRAESGPLKGKWTIDRLAFRPPSTLTFLIDDRERFSGFHQRAYKNGEYIDVAIPGAHSFYYSAREEERAFYGRSYFEAAFKVWETKYKLYQIMHQAAMRAATGTRVAKVAEACTDGDLAELQTALDDFAFGSSIITPEWVEDLQVLREATSFDFLAYLNHYNNQMSKSVLGQFIDESQGTGGDTAVVKFGQSSDTYFMMMLSSIQDDMASVINDKIIPRFIDWNFGSGKYPEFRWGPLNDTERAIVHDTYTEIMGVSAGDKGSSREVRLALEKRWVDQMGLDVDMVAVADRLAKEWKSQDETATKTVPVDHAELEAREAAAAQTIAEAEQAAKMAEPVSVEDTQGLPIPEGFSLAGPRVVRDDQGAKWFGQPVGSVVKDDRLNKGESKRPEVSSGTKSSKGEESAPEVVGAEEVLMDPRGNGVKLVRYADGTVALRLPDGRESVRRNFSIEEFIKLGWKPLGSQEGAE